MTRWRSLAGLAAGVALLAACTGEDGPEVRVETVGRADVVEIVNAPATVAARAQATVSAPAEGTIAEVLVADGERVTTGQPLVRVSSPGAQERLRQAREADARAAAATPGTVSPDLTAFQAQVDAAARAAFVAAYEAADRIEDDEERQQARRAVARAESEYAAARLRSLAALRDLERGVGSASRAVASLGEAQRVQTRAAVSVAQATVDALLVRAPIGGTVQLGGAAGSGGGDGGVGALVGSLPESVQGQAQQLLGGSDTAETTAQIVPGAPVGTGTPLVTVFDLSAVHLVAAVDETDVFLVTKGVRADVELDAVPDARYSATVAAIDLSPTESSRGGVTYRVRLTLGPGTHAGGAAAPRPRPGMSAVADLRVRNATGAVAVPAAAVIRQGDRDAVWLVTGGRAQARVVRLGAQGDDLVQVVEGLAEGDRIVTRGADTVGEGDRVP